MKFIENGFEMSKAMVAALASVRNTKKGAHPACRLWYWDPTRTALHIVGESMLLRCVGDIVEFADNDPSAFPFDVEILRKDVLPHVKKGTFVRIVARDTGVEAYVVQEAEGEIPEEVLCTVGLNHDCCPAPPPIAFLDANVPAMVDPGESAAWHVLQGHLDSVAKVAKVLKATSVRLQGPADGKPSRVDFAVPEEAGRWCGMMMPVKLPEP